MTKKYKPWDKYNYIGDVCMLCKKPITINNKSKKCHSCRMLGHKINLGRKLSEEHKLKISISHKNELNPMWKGNNVTKSPLHNWVRRHKPKPDFCELCKVVPPYDLANISQKYYRDVNDFEWICRKCHMNKDSRIKNLKQNAFKK